jgi:hypothetical protein
MVSRSVLRSFLILCVAFQVAACAAATAVRAQSILRRGDVNANGLPYEVADFIDFKDYLLQGSAAFTYDSVKQLQACDINSNDVPGTVADFYYLYRVIIGDSVPFPGTFSRSASDTVFLTQNSINKTVTVQYADVLHAVYLVFKGKITPFKYWASKDTVWYYYDSTYTRVVVAPGLSFEPTIPAISNGAFLIYQGSGDLVSAQAASDGVYDPATLVQRDIQGPCCIHRGNVDRSADGAVDIADLAALLDYLFDTGFFPPDVCWEEVNVDAVPGIDISDLQALVDFLFNGQPLSPCTI